MATEEELKAAEEARKAAEAKTAAETEAKKAAEEAAKKEAEKQASFEKWLAEQPESVRQLYNEHVTGLKTALQSEREKSKGVGDKLKKLADLEKAEDERKKAAMTETERLQAELQEAKNKAAKFERESLQRQAADKAGLPAAFADRIRGETLDDMVEDAKGLLEAMPKSEQKPKPSTTATNPGAGHQGAETDEQKRARLFGVQVDPFAEDVLRQKGGGVYFIKEE